VERWWNSVWIVERSDISGKSGSCGRMIGGGACWFGCCCCVVAGGVDGWVDVERAFLPKPRRPPRFSFVGGETGVAFSIGFSFTSRDGLGSGPVAISPARAL
jgi:hypothetical protein